jgi:predicted aspartyl protease
VALMLRRSVDAASCLRRGIVRLSAYIHARIAHWAQRDHNAQMLRNASIWLLLGLALAHTGACATSAELDSTAIEADEPLASRTTLDAVGRILAPVMINGRGPFRLLVDTGANSSMISTRLADELGIAYSSEATVMLNGVTGSALMPTAEIELLQSGALVLKNQQVVVLTSEMVDSADGILGIAGLRDRLLIVDFKRGRVSIERSKRVESALIRVPAERMDSGLLVARAKVDGVSALAIIDTGAASTLGNRALQEALSKAGRVLTVPVLGATPHVAVGDMTAIKNIAIGAASISNARITFGDFHVFGKWDLLEQPALILGMDVIGTVDLMKIDFRRLEVAFGTSQERGWPRAYQRGS